MTASNLTPWFPGNVKPVRIGVYERKAFSWVLASYWDGRLWRAGPTRNGPRSNYQNRCWRGLATNPATGATE